MLNTNNKKKKINLNNETLVVGTAMLGYKVCTNNKNFSLSNKNKHYCQVLQFYESPKVFLHILCQTYD